MVKQSELQEREKISKGSVAPVTLASYLSLLNLGCFIRCVKTYNSLAISIWIN